MARGGWKSPPMVARCQHHTPERDAELASKLPRLGRDAENSGGHEESEEDDPGSALAIAR